MNYQKFKITSRIDKSDYMLIEIDMDTINDADPTMNLIEESLNICEHLICPQTKEFIEDWENDELFPTLLKYITDSGKPVTRNKYKIELK